MSDSYETVRSYIQSKVIDYIPTLCEKYVCPKFVQNTLLKKPAFTKIIVLIDVSGSTDNRSGSSRFATDDPSDSKSETKTKIIIMAELEGIANHLVQMMSIYDLTGVAFMLYAFSTDVEKCTDIKSINSNDAFYSIVVQNLDLIVLYAGASTNLHVAISEVFKSCKDDDKIELIIATDGRTSDADQTFELLKNQTNFNLFIIGAGSVIAGADVNNTRGMYVNQIQTTRNGTRYAESTVTVTGTITGSGSGSGTVSKISSSAECDMDYLQNLAKTSLFKGVYCGAYGTYDDLIKASQEYFAHTCTEYKVKLDNNLGLLDPRVQEPLRNGSCCFVSTPHGSFVMVPESGTEPPFQITVSPIYMTDGSPIPTFLIGDIRHTLQICEGSNPTFQKCFDHQLIYMYELSAGKLKCGVCVDQKHFMRVRELVKITSGW